ncbi:MAG TPA: Wadjet anti-phage system protein JetD domain-containing protein [Ktedonobacteraceae bacterium]|nr:Wadjet anti-phage system protein JetD domain-containing protein [Ktedonobacteraceae bacterium]
MITPADIYQKATRLYLPFLRAWLGDAPFFPQEFPVGKLPSDYVELRKGVRALQVQSKEARGRGYTLEYQVQQKRFSGQQTVPVRAIVETEQDFLWLIEKEEEFRQFRQDVALIREQLPQLAVWVERSPQKATEQHGLWPELLAVCRYFLDHPTSNLYIRELPINVHTKFIEQHRGIVRELLEQLLPQEAIALTAATFEQRFGLREKEPFVRVRLLDEQLYTRYRLPLTELSVPVSQLEALDLLRGQRCIVTENEMTFLTLSPCKDAFALFGGGFMVRNLESISWLAQCPIIYWGDLDAQGFQILSSLRAFFPHVVSAMMDWETLSAFSEFCVAGTPCLIRQLPHLTDEEHALFLHLAENNLRLEQEHISHTYAVRQLYSIMSGARYEV